MGTEPIKLWSTPYVDIWVRCQGPDAADLALTNNLFLHMFDIARSGPKASGTFEEIIIDFFVCIA